MFKFSTNTLINSLFVPGFAGVSAAEGADAIKDHRRFWVETKGGEKILRIAKHFKFNKKNVVAAYKRAWEAPQLFKVTFDLSTIISKYDNPNTISVAETEGTGRIELYVRLSGSQNSYYANDFVFKGKPFFVEFPIKKGDTEEVLAKRIARIAKKYQNMVYEFPQIRVYASDDKGEPSESGKFVTVAGTDEYQVIHKAELQWYNETAMSYDCCASFGAFEEENKGALVLQGHEGFGTYRQIIKDLRLPTAANTRWNRIVIDEAPIFGGHYNQYTIKMCVNRGIMGSDAVGEVTKSLTTHVFYVLDGEVSQAFETALKEVIGEDAIQEVVDKDYDDYVKMSEKDVEAAFDDAKVTRDVQEEAHGSVNKNNTDITAAPNALEEGKRKPTGVETEVTGSKEGGDGNNEGGNNAGAGGN